MDLLRQTPDDQGYVTVNWPSQKVPHGGVFHSKNVDVNNASFLKLLIHESKLDTELRKRRPWALRDYSSDRGDSEAFRGAQSGREQETCSSAAIQRPHTSRRRSLSAIKMSGALDSDSWRPTERGEDREKLIEQLQEVMEWGEKRTIKQIDKRANAQADAVLEQKLPSKHELRQELLTQIRERAEWLQDMELLGQGAPHRQVIHEQIAQRFRTIDELSVNTARTDVVARRGCAQQIGEESCRTQDGESARSNIPSLRLPKTHANTNKSGMRRTTIYPRQATSSKSPMSSKNKTELEENINAYKTPTPLGFSPRRRL